MKIKFIVSPKAIPELADLPDHEKIRIWKKFNGKGFQRLATWAALIISILWTILILHIRISVQYAHPNWNSYLLIILQSIIGLGGGYSFFFTVWIYNVRPYIRDYITRTKKEST